MKTVARVIGQKMGTGGSAGVDYLVKALNQLLPRAMVDAHAPGRR